MSAPNRVAFTLFGIDIMWYGILIAVGMVLAVAIVYKRAPKHGIASDKVLDFVLLCIPMGIIGARLYYVIFEWNNDNWNLIKILDIRSGGLAIHGGLLFGFGTAAILCYLWHYRPFNVLDLTVPAVALAQSIGRWGNFFNGEAHGGPTNLPWGILVDGQKVHPTFLYESIWCFLLFFLLIYVDNRRKFEGQIFLLYGILYSVERFFVEQLRTDSLMLGPFLKQAQVLSLTVFLVFTVVYIFLARRAKGKNKSLPVSYDVHKGTD